MIKKAITTLLIMLFLGNLVFAADGKSDIQMEMHNLLELNWKISEQLSNGEMNFDLISELDSKTENLVNNLIEAIKNEDEKTLNMIKEEFELLDVHSQNFIYCEVITAIEEFSRTESIPNYLPGYGYTDTDYIYKLGKEVESKISQSYWKKEKKIIQSNKEYTFYVKMEIAAEMGAQIGGGANSGVFNITGEAHFSVNGKLEKFAQTKIITNETVETETLLMYEKHRVVFEVWRAPKNNTNGWEMDGTTFLYKEFPADTTIILDPGQIFGF
ncbi:MAG: hypothetical protein WC002_03205 [Candidatus Muiribacteriota bacterium]